MKIQILGSCIVLILCGVRIFACGCVDMGFPEQKAVEIELQSSKAVFIGKVTGFEWRADVLHDPSTPVELDSQGKPIPYKTKMVRFEIERYWKMPMPSEFFLATDETSYKEGSSAWTSCHFQFDIGKTYIVFAYQIKDRDFLATSVCTRTRLLERAGDTVQFLGKGYTPAIKVKR
jgi:hypothetical protein